MTPEKFSAIVKKRFSEKNRANDMGHTRFAKATGYTAQTVRRFASGEQDVPVAIAILLALMEWIDLDHTDIADIVEAETKEKAARKSK